jgi:uridylate kinase
MKKRVVVLSLGGSLIIPDQIDTKFLKKFKKIIKKNTKKYKFAIACGGGNVARKYMSALKKEGSSFKLQSFSGISATRMNARFMTHFFGFDSEYGIPHNLESVKKYLKKRDIVFFGGLEYRANQTSDSTAAQVAKVFKSSFINLTNVQGLYNKNPSKFKNAKFISKISWTEFDKMTQKLKFHPGQHFVLDQTASKIIKKHKIPTYIIGQNLKNLDLVLRGEKFKGTLIKG